MERAGDREEETYLTEEYIGVVTPNPRMFLWNLSFSVSAGVWEGQDGLCFLFEGKREMDAFPILHVAEMWKRGHNNLIRDALVFIPFKVGKTE